MIKIKLLLFSKCLVFHPYACTHVDCVHTKAGNPRQERFSDMKKAMKNVEKNRCSRKEFWYLFYMVDSYQAQNRRLPLAHRRRQASQRGELRKEKNVAIKQPLHGAVQAHVESPISCVCVYVCLCVCSIYVHVYCSPWSICLRCCVS